MPTFTFKAMDAQGQEIEDVIEAQTQDEAQATIRQMGYFVTKISAQKSEKTGSAATANQRRKTFAVTGAGGKTIVRFTRQLSILQDAGLPILRSLKILEGQQKPGALKNSLIDVCDEIEGGSTLSEALGKSPKTFDRLYVNMIKAGEAGGSLEVILQRLAEFKERTQSLKNKIVGAMIYPVMVVLFTVMILTFIMLFIIPEFKKMFEEFEMKLPVITELLIELSNKIAKYWILIPLIPICIIAFIMLVRKFKAGRFGFDLAILKVPVLGKLTEKSNLARTQRTLGALVASGVPILESIAITRETSGNSVYEKLFLKVSDSIREGETIARPLRIFSKTNYHPVAHFFWLATGAVPPLGILLIKPELTQIAVYGAVALGVLTGMLYLLWFKTPCVEELVINMVDVGEETGELDVMLYKVADYYEEEVNTLTEGMIKLIEPLLIIFLGLTILFIVAALFLPLVSMISGLAGGGDK